MASLESYSGLNLALTPSGAIPAARLSRVDQASVLVRDSGSSQPLIASVPYGFGRVTLVGVDIDPARIRESTANAAAAGE